VDGSAQCDIGGCPTYYVYLVSHFHNTASLEAVRIWPAYACTCFTSTLGGGMGIFLFLDNNSFHIVHSILREWNHGTCILPFSFSGKSTVCYEFISKVFFYALVYIYIACNDSGRGGIFEHIRYQVNQHYATSGCHAKASRRDISVLMLEINKG
jgi:hypothetical protein